MAFKFTKKNKEILMYFALAVLAYFVWEHFMQNKTPSPVVEGFPGEGSGRGLQCRANPRDSDTEGNMRQRRQGATHGVFDYNSCIADSQGSLKKCKSLFEYFAEMNEEEGFMCGYVDGDLPADKLVDNALSVNYGCPSTEQTTNCDEVKGQEDFSDFKCSGENNDEICYGELLDSLPGQMECILDVVGEKGLSQKEVEEQIRECAEEIEIVGRSAVFSDGWNREQEQREREMRRVMLAELNQGNDSNKGNGRVGH